LARKKGIVGLASLAGALIAVALLPAAASAHPCVSATGGSAAFLSIDTTSSWAGSLPAGAAQNIKCAESSYQELTAAIATTAAADPVGPAVASFTYSDNMTPVGFSARDVPGNSLAAINSDLAFKGNLVYEGHWNGFRIIDASDPANPVQLSNYEQCAHPSGQGDVVVWGDILVRTWDSASNTGALTCGGQLVGTGFEGIHIFNVADPTNPVFVGQLRMAGATSPANSVPPLACGAHTATAVPDPARDNLYLYVGGSSGNCLGMDVVKIKISDPSQVTYVGRANAGRQCHDNNVILGSVNMAMCAGGNGFSVFKFDPALDPSAAGGIENPTLLYSRSLPGVNPAHSGSFSYDGKVLIFGWEPGGGTGARCVATGTAQNIIDRTLYFYDAEAGTQVGTLLQPRPQTAQENCTWHNFNVVPTYKGRTAIVGSYQMGITAIDFTDPANPSQFAFADPAPLTTTGIRTGGDWSTYWHNGKLYEADIRRGLIIWDLNDERENRARTLTGDNNPQTQMTSFEQDLGKPTIDIASPVAGSVLTKDSVVLADFSCADAETAVESCVGTVADGAPVATGQIGSVFEFTVTAKDLAGNTETKTVVYSVLNTTADGNVSGTVPATLSLTVGPPAQLGAFTPGVAKEYFGQTGANVISTGGDAALSVADTSSNATGHLVNGAFSLPQPLQARATNAANTATTFANVGSAASPLNLLTYSGPTSNDAVSLQFRQLIGSSDPLRTGTYSKTLTFTLSTTTP
jgi:hypothetical protein